MILHTSTSTEGNSTESTSTTHSVKSILGIVVGMLFVLLMVSLLAVFICYCYVKKNTKHQPPLGRLDNNSTERYGNLEGLFDGNEVIYSTINHQLSHTEDRNGGMNESAYSTIPSSQPVPPRATQDPCSIRQFYHILPNKSTSDSDRASYNTVGGGQEAVAQPAAVPSSLSVPIYSQVTKKKDRKKAKENITTDIGHETETAHVKGLCGTIGGQEVVSKTVAQPVAVASSPGVPIYSQVIKKRERKGAGETDTSMDNMEDTTSQNVVKTQPAAVPSSPSVPIYSQVIKKKDRKRAGETNNTSMDNMEDTTSQNVVKTQPAAVSSTLSVSIYSQVIKKKDRKRAGETDTSMDNMEDTTSQNVVKTQPAAVSSTPSVPIYSQVIKKKDRKRAGETDTSMDNMEDTTCNTSQNAERAHTQGLCDSNSSLSAPIYSQVIKKKDRGARETVDTGQVEDGLSSCDDISDSITET